ncbi:MAG TPA: chemotaxis protein CheX [Terriglobales bacterium]|nr:chemotaxis protein CheX [Terriglobales bacterium]
MQIYEEEIYRITKTVWQSFLGLGLKRRRKPLETRGETRFLMGYVEITGAWLGVLRLDCSFPLARRMAAMMFCFEAEQTTIDDIRDALGEVANTIGGNVKGLLPGPCGLSLPVVVDGTGDRLHLPGRTLTRIDLECEREPFRVMLLSYPGESMQKEQTPGREGDQCN